MPINLRIVTFEEPGAFLDHVQDALEQNEKENHLILGICRRMAARTSREGIPPFLAAIESEAGIELAAVMTPPFPLVLAPVGVSCQEAYPLLGTALLQNSWDINAVNGRQEVSHPFAEYWSGITGAGYEVENRHRLYSLTKVQFPQEVSGYLRKATAADQPLVLEWGQAFHHEALTGTDSSIVAGMVTNHIKDGNVYLWEVDERVSMAIKNRPTRNGIAVSYVYTPPRVRRNGYASACVAALSQALLDNGYRFCTLFTDLNNPTTNRIYQQIGYRPVADFTAYRFA